MGPHGLECWRKKKGWNGGEVAGRRERGRNESRVARRQKEVCVAAKVSRNEVDEEGKKERDKRRAAKSDAASGRGAHRKRE